MDITWYGHSCFRFAERNRISIVTDPYSEEIGLPPLRLKADVVTISHDEAGHNHYAAVKGTPHLLTGPGEYEMGGVFVTGIQLHYIQEDAVRWNIAYKFDYDDLTVVHLGDLAHIPDQSTLEQFGEVHVLLLPVGGGKGLRASQAAEVVALIEPHFIIPMHYALPDLRFELEPVDKFLKAMGVSSVQEMDTLKISGGEMQEQSQVILLKPQISA
ncbi:MAG: MBL fold metallo-hydrolase [Anaerolineae bacterium]|nr:MBL fold metallo-hydrolase [Anaerolineae bacterium]